MESWFQRATERLGREVEFRSVAFRDMEVRAVDDSRTAEGYICRWGVIDTYGNRFRQGAFTSAGLDDKPYAFLWMHEPYDPAGLFTASEDASGLFIRIAYDATDTGERAYQRAKSGSAAELSIGFIRKGDEVAQDGVTEITRAELVEGSQITARFAAQPGAALAAVRMKDANQAAESELRRRERAAKAARLRFVELPV
jgi:HK97 family phage prohead protease